MQPILPAFDLSIIPGATNLYSGKVRETCVVDDKMIMVTTDRISAFDVILPRPIPYKGQVLNQMSAYFLTAAKDICPVWLTDQPHPNVSIGLNCEPIKVEMVIRGYLTGSAWRLYESGINEICGIPLPDDMKQYGKFMFPIITPTTKAAAGHDLNISKKEILEQGLVSKEHYEKMEMYAEQLFELGTRMAKRQGLILVDTKYEFGIYNGEVYLIDEIHTPDSSRYWHANRMGQPGTSSIGKQEVSKEFVREWLRNKGFQGEPGQTVPEMPDEVVEQISELYIDLYKKMTGLNFKKSKPAPEAIVKAIEESLALAKT